MEDGKSVKDAATKAMMDIHELKSFGGMNCLAIDAKGNPISATTAPDRESVYWYMDVDSEESELRKGIQVLE